ncbi:PREDICTED: pre-mRNA-splicing factor 38B isoform X3 [Vollenhovia emeryi]|uniref:pre-mRNA-splicing factor 38B isoform X3 n=1 Tax=Vollenhovia emeryi TaxID=411798 RepID=UPI0005F3684C|nr:PREDICTED: pre-mRNA-splicing factor 38B isoform X3 [Vollenhovia emeryi]
MQVQEAEGADGSPWNNSSGCDEERRPAQKECKKSNVLPLWGNERTMNLNPLILTNIQSSHYFKVNLYELKTYHEVIDEIYYKVSHLEPWEKGSRKTAGQTGMCGGRFMQVRGVGAGGIVSTAYCLLYKLFTLRLTRKQLNGLINHPDSPYIRALGFMYIRYTQPPADLFSWYSDYLEDEEELDVKAGGGQTMKMGDILKQFLTKLEWFSTLFPRIPVPIQKDLELRLAERFPQQQVNARNAKPPITLNSHGKYGNKEGRKDNEPTRTVKTRIESAIESARDCGNVTEKELANGIAKETSTANGLAVVIKIKDRGIIKVAAETDPIEIEAGITIVTEIDIGTKEVRRTTMPQSWHASARGNEGKENERRKQLHTVYIFNYFYYQLICN